MKIVSKARPIVLSGKLQWLQSNSRGILLFALYASGMAVGGTVDIAAVSVRKYAQETIIYHYMETASFASAFLLLCIAAACCVLLLFGAGLCLIGAVSIYLTPLILGAAAGIGVITVMGQQEPMALLKSILLLPFFSAAICCLLQLCEYAAEINAILVGGINDRGVGQQRQYAIRFMILSGFIALCNAGQALTTVLLRHIR